VSVHTVAVSAFRRVSDVVLAMSLVVILWVTLTPGQGTADVQLVPFVDLVDALNPPIDAGLLFGAAGNIVLFFPLGVALSLRGYSGRKAAFCGFLLSAAVETAQLFLPGRTTATEDVILNTTGAFLGWIVVSMVSGARARRAAPGPVEPGPAQLSVRASTPAGCRGGRRD
jgi:glycopeptide antibiotics resistance protein